MSQDERSHHGRRRLGNKNPESGELLGHVTLCWLRWKEEECGIFHRRHQMWTTSSALTQDSLSSAHYTIVVSFQTWDHKVSPITYSNLLRLLRSFCLFLPAFSLSLCLHLCCILSFHSSNSSPFPHILDLLHHYFPFMHSLLTHSNWAYFRPSLTHDTLHCYSARTGFEQPQITLHLLH